jgi:single-strand DNA-binding protein
VNGITAAALGTLPRDGELKYTQSGQAVLNFSIAVHDAKRGEDAQTEWLKVAVWGDLAERLTPQALKGVEVYVEGRIRLNTWQRQDGQQRAGLTLTAWKVDVLGAIGVRAPLRDDQDEQRARIQTAAAEGAERAAQRGERRYPVGARSGRRYSPTDDEAPF